MITNEGFRDIIHIARHQRVEHYSIMQELPWQNRPLVKRRHRKVVGGRLVPPRGERSSSRSTRTAVRRAAIELRDEGVESVAICFLFSYLNPAHENRAKAIVSEVLPDAFVTTSVGGVAAVPRVRALHHRVADRLHRPEGPALHRPSRRRPEAKRASPANSA